MFRGSSLVGLAAMLLLSVGCTPMVGVNVSPSTGASGDGTTSRELLLGQTVRGVLAAEGDADEYVVRVPAGAAINAVLEVPHAGNATQLRGSVHRQHPVTKELTFSTAAIVGSDEGEASATEPVTLDSDGMLIVRVEGLDARFGGAYVLHVLPTTRRNIRLGEVVREALQGRGDSDDYTLSVERGERFNVRLVAPHQGTRRLIQVQVFERDAVTGALRFLAGAIADSREGQPAATDPIIASGAGTYVIRVHGMEAAGAYELVTERL